MGFLLLIIVLEDKNMYLKEVQIRNYKNLILYGFEEGKS